MQSNLIRSFVYGLCVFFFPPSSTHALDPIPDKLVVLTFDDSSKSHFTIARPILKKHGFKASFFITEGWDFTSNKRDYMSWDEIVRLHQDGFEIGNHTKDHQSVTTKTLEDLSAQLRAINARCREHGIPETTSFAYPGNAIHKDGLAILKANGIRFARRGGSPEYPYKEGRGFPYEPGLDHPLLIPTTGDARPGWTLADLQRAVLEAKHGKIAVLQFHGVPDTAHDWVTTSTKQFEQYMQYLADNKYTVIAMRDLARYVDPNVVPKDAWGVIEDRKKLVEKSLPPDNFRKPTSDADLQAWLENMALHHHYTPSEIGAALGLTANEVVAALERLHITPGPGAKSGTQSKLLVLPYPGGRHPRIGFLDGAIRPQRETKVSVFAPWVGGGYAVADVPEAIWFEPGGKRELLYLAHAHVPTTWDKQNITLPRLEWSRAADGTLRCERTLPNGVTFGTHVMSGDDGVRMEFWVKNGTKEKLTGLHVQMCVMLKALAGFEQQTNENKTLASPFAACRDASGKRWIITGWEQCSRAWANPPCPCLHADPKLPDSAPGETQRVRGWLSFYEGTDIDAELKRLQRVAFAR